MTNSFAVFIALALLMIVVALAFVIMPPLMRKKGEEKGDNKNRADWRFALAAAIFVVAVAPGLYWLSGAPESFAPKSDADVVVGILLSAAARAQEDGDDKSATLLRQQAQLILQSSGDEQRAIIRRILQSAQDAIGESQQ